MKLTWNFQHSLVFAKGFRKKMENLLFNFWTKEIKIGCVNISAWSINKIATEENFAPKRAISKNVPFTTAKVLDYIHVSINFLFLVDCALKKFYKDNENMPVVSFTNLELTLSAPIPKSGKTHSNNSSANCRRIVWVCTAILLIWRLKNFHNTHFHNMYRKSFWHLDL